MSFSIRIVPYWKTTCVLGAAVGNANGGGGRTEGRGHAEAAEGYVYIYFALISLLPVVVLEPKHSEPHV